MKYVNVAQLRKKKQIKRQELNWVSKRWNKYLKDSIENYPNLYES